MNLHNDIRESKKIYIKGKMNINIKKKTLKKGFFIFFGAQIPEFILFGVSHPN